jgi:hypothetical protein
MSEIDRIYHERISDKKSASGSINACTFAL